MEYFLLFNDYGGHPDIYYQVYKNIMKNKYFEIHENDFNYVNIIGHVFTIKTYNGEKFQKIIDKY